LSTVFLGTTDFAAAILERLATSERHRPALVLTRPDRPRGRGRRLASPPVAERARALGLALEQPNSVNDVTTVERIASAAPEAIVVCAFGALIKEPLLSLQELLNVHPSLLPRWRGAAPIERAIMAGDRQTGVSILRLTAGLDSGPVCLAEPEPIDEADTYGSLAPRLAELGATLLLRVLDEKAQGHPPAFVEQDEAPATYAEKIGPHDRLLDPSRDARELERVVRALHPHIGARVELPDGTLLGVHRASLAPDPSIEEASRQDPSRVDQSRDDRAGGHRGRGAGQRQGVLCSEGRLLLVCASGALDLLVVQPPGGRAMDAEAYLRGHGLPGRA
jgi:methionyl-tRNA formyltransferase